MGASRGNAMRASALLLLLMVLGAPALQAEPGVYYINKGVKYHIGDNRYDQSEDATFLDTYPVVGQEWIQAFTVDRDDAVQVDIEHIWGVDDCPYCKVLISIDETPMGRLTQDFNHHPFTTPLPLAKKVSPGKVYLLKIASYGDTKVDDFVISDVVVRTQAAKVTMLEPGPVLKSPEQPMPQFFPPSPPPKGPCEGLAPQRNWLGGFSEGHPAPQHLLPQPKAFSESQPLLMLQPGQQGELWLRLMRAPESVDRVGQPVEVLLGMDAPSGWALLFAPGAEQLQHGNLLRQGHYSSESFGALWKARAWNRLDVVYCTDGFAHLQINGVNVKRVLQGMSGALPLRVRSQGLDLQIGGSDPGLADTAPTEDEP